VVKVQLNLVRRRADRLVAGELQLGDQILVGILGESAALIGIQKDVVDVQRRGNEGLIVRDSRCDGGTNGLLRRGGVSTCTIPRRGVAAEGCDGPQTLVDGADVKVDLDLVVLEGNQRERQTGVGAKPKLKGNVKRCLGERITGGTYLAGSNGVTWSVNISERGIGDECELCGVTDHLEVTTLLFGSHGKLIPDMHPVTILTIYALTANLDLNLGDELFAGVIQPTSIDGVISGSERCAVAHQLVDLGECYLEICAVA